MQNAYAIPKQYTRSSSLKRWFIDGFTSGFRNDAAVQADDFRRIQGESVWSAYTDGYHAGQDLRGPPADK